MRNERRGSPRMPIALEAVISYQDLAYPCRIRNLSLSGAYLETGTGIPRDIPIELGLTGYISHQGRGYRLPAMVKRQMPDGVGVRFAELEIEAYFTLVDLVYTV